MQEILNRILDWPVLIQAVLGSFLFWAIFKLGEVSINYISSKLRAENELGSAFGKLARKSYLKDNSPEKSNFNFFICIYAALHYFLKFVIVIFISSIINDFLPIFGYVGYIIGFYFIFRSISYVTHFDNFHTPEEKAANKQLMKNARLEKSRKK